MEKEEPKYCPFFTLSREPVEYCMKNCALNEDGICAFVSISRSLVWLADVVGKAKDAEIEAENNAEYKQARERFFGEEKK